MGAFIVADIAFKKSKDRKKFEEVYKIKRKDILVSEKSQCYGFCAWTMVRDPVLNPVYNLGFMGYAEPEDMLKDCKKSKIDITFFAWLPINDKAAKWEKIKGRW